MKGITKLKIGLVIILLVELMALSSGWLSSDLSDREFQEFNDRLNPTEQNQLSNIYSKYPDTSPSDTVLNIGGLLVWVYLFMTAFLLYKVWKVKKIE